METAIRCPACGTNNESGSRYCGDCGEALPGTVSGLDAGMDLVKPLGSKANPQDSGQNAAQALGWVAAIATAVVVVLVWVAGLKAG